MSERRRFFRIDDHVILKVRKVDEHEIGPSSHPGKAWEHDEILKALMGMDAQAKTVISRVREIMPDVGQALDVLNNKLNLLTRAVSQHDQELSLEDTQPVNLSGSGMAYCSDEPLENGNFVELELTLFPSYHYIVTYAKVVHSEPADEGRQRISVEFYQLREEDREVLMQHIFRREGEMLRLRRDEQA